MEQTAFIEKAIPFVSVDSDGKYVLTNQAKSFLKEIKGKIGVVSVAGMYRTGKSYLLNRMLLNRSNGFGVGPTINPCTKGLWCWGTPLKGYTSDGDEVSVIVIDTEGIGAMDEDQTHDTKIFTLAILAASCFIYNSTGSIDESAIQNLSLVVNLTQHIQLKSNSNLENDASDLSGLFPTFYWVVRDFTLQLVDTNHNAITSKQYLDKALANQPNPTMNDDIEEKNKIRSHLTSFFPDRDCFTLVRPVGEESLLQRLDTLQFSQLRPEFVDQVSNFKKKVLKNMKIKTLENKALDGHMYLSMMLSYVQAINDGAVPNIQNAWNYMCQEQSKKAMDDLFKLFIEQLEEKMKVFPCSDEDFRSITRNVEEEILEMFRQKNNGEKSDYYLKEFKQRLSLFIAEKQEQNQTQGKQMIKNALKDSLNILKNKLTQDVFKSYEEFQIELKKTNQHLLKFGPKVSNYKLYFEQGLRSVTSQGAKRICASLKKEQQNSLHLWREKETNYHEQIERLNQTIKTQNERYKESISAADQKIANLTFELEHAYVQSTTTHQRKQDQFDKLLKNYQAKKAELQKKQSEAEIKVNDLQSNFDSFKRQTTKQKRQWEKQKALADQKIKQQMSEIDELQRKEKSLDSTLCFEKNNIKSQLREITQKLEQQKILMKKQLADTHERLSQVTLELNNLKQESEKQVETLQKNIKKQKDEFQSKLRELQKSKKDAEFDKKNIEDTNERKTQTFRKQQSDMRAKISLLEEETKRLKEENMKQKNNLTTENEILRQEQMFLQEQLDKEKRNVDKLKQNLEMADQGNEELRSKLRSEEQNQKIKELKEEQIRQIYDMKETMQMDKKKLENQIDKLTNALRNLQAQDHNNTLNLQKIGLELLELKQTSKQEKDKLYEQIKNLERQRANIILEKDRFYQDRCKQLEEEIDQIKDRSEKDRIHYDKSLEEAKIQIKSNFDMDRENLDKKILSEKEKYTRKLKIIEEEHQKKIREELEPLQLEHQQLQENYEYEMQSHQTTSKELQALEDEQRKKEAQHMKAIKTLTEMHGRRQNELIIKIQQQSVAYKAQIQKRMTEITNISSDLKKKQLQHLTMCHEKQQVQNSLQKSEIKLSQAENDLTSQKQKFYHEIEGYKSKIKEIEEGSFEQKLGYEKQTAVLRQKMQYNLSKIQELYQKLENDKYNFEEQVRKIREDKEAELKSGLEKITNERVSLEQKYKDLKINTKETVDGLKKQIVEIQKYRAVFEEKSILLEAKINENQLKHKEEAISLKDEIKKTKENEDQLKKRSTEEINNLLGFKDRSESQIRQLTGTIEKERLLTSQKIKHLEESKQSLKRDLEEKIKKQENIIENLTFQRESDKSQHDTAHSESIKSLENKYRNKIDALNTEITQITHDSDILKKQAQGNYRSLNQKYQNQKSQKEAAQSNNEKRMNELGEQLKRLNDEVEKLRVEKDLREKEYQRKQKEERENYKFKLQNAQSRQREAEQAKRTAFFEHQNLKRSWKINEDHLNDKLRDAEEKIETISKKLQKMNRENEKLKYEKKNNTSRATSFIAMKTNYGEKKEEENKQNFMNQ